MEDNNLATKIAEIDKAVAVLKESTKYHKMEGKKGLAELEKELLEIKADVEKVNKIHYARLTKLETDVTDIKAFQAKLAGAVSIASLLWQYFSEHFKFPG